MNGKKAPPPGITVELARQLDRVEAKLDLLIGHFVQPRVKGEPVVKCSCGRLSTRTLVVDHKLHGSRSQQACDECHLTGEAQVFFELGGELTVKPSNADLQAYARKVNGLLSS